MHRVIRGSEGCKGYRGVESVVRYRGCRGMWGIGSLDQ